MSPPFTVEQFLGVFARYNVAVWPAQVVFYALAVWVVVRAVKDGPPADRLISGALAFLWAWMGVVYQWGFFAAINPAAYLFGALFVLQAVLFQAAGVLRARLRFRFRPDAFGAAGVVLIAYALVVYPLLGALTGHPYPRGPTFGLPCPTTIFTFGLLLWAARPVPLWVIVIPAAWSGLGSFAALSFTIAEDYGLLAAGVVGSAMILRKNRQHVQPMERGYALCAGCYAVNRALSPAWFRRMAPLADREGAQYSYASRAVRRTGETGTTTRTATTASGRTTCWTSSTGSGTAWSCRSRSAAATGSASTSGSLSGTRGWSAGRRMASRWLAKRRRSFGRGGTRLSSRGRWSGPATQPDARVKEPPAAQAGGSRSSAGSSNPGAVQNSLPALLPCRHD